MAENETGTVMLPPAKTQEAFVHIGFAKAKLARGRAFVLAILEMCIRDSLPAAPDIGVDGRRNRRRPLSVRAPRLVCGFARRRCHVGRGDVYKRQGA